ncbi:hypothetical protein GF312_04830 [Candidatus Poribacteria bacterium]|nr:hypothetical protein [Candidatus Poribacteria bacterium]
MIPFCFITLLIFGNLSFDDGLISDIENQLMIKGFEDIRVLTDSKGIIIEYENRIYRYPIRAIKEIMEIISSRMRDETSVTLIPHNRGLPLYSITFSIVEYKRLLDTKPELNRGINSLWKAFKALTKKPSANCDEFQKTDTSFDTGREDNSGSFFHRKFNILLIPQFKAVYGAAVEPVKSQFNLVPEINASFWKGMLLTSQLVIPIQNELEPEDDNLRSGLLTLNQVNSWFFNVFTSVTAGYFTQRRYGLDLEIRKYMYNGRWSIGINSGYTGYAAYIDGIWYYSDVGLFTWLMDIEYWISRIDMKLRYAYGKFLYGDKGWRLDISRRSDEYQLGFFVYKTVGEENVGFTFGLPVPPAKNLHFGSLTLGLAKEFNQEYRYRSYREDGVQYNTGHCVDKFLNGLTPERIIKQLKEMEN